MAIKIKEHETIEENSYKTIVDKMLINTAITKKFLEALINQYSEYHILLVWDNAPFHRKKELQEMEGITPMFLPSYSPELNPVERFYGEVRKSNANRLFQNIEIQKNVIEEEVVKWMKDTDKTQNLCGYDWIIDYWKNC